MTFKLKTQHLVIKKAKAFLFIALAVICSSCYKTTEHIGDGLLPEDDHIGVAFTDTLEIICHSELIDSMNTGGMSNLLFGSIVDPVMGVTNANIFTQLHISSANQWFGADPLLDSIVLQLAVTGYYGDTNTMQTLHVYALTDSMSIENNYYQFSDIACEPIDVANSYQFYPRPFTTHHVVGNDTLSHAIIRVRLDDSFGYQLIHADSSHYSSPDAFKRYLPGLKISCESLSQGGAITYINPTVNDLTLLQIYYRENATSETRMRYNFFITSEDMYFNQYLHDYSLGSPEFVQQVVQGDTALGQEKIYLQAMGGVRTVLNFPNISHWMDSLETHTHIVINEAKLIFPGMVDAADSGIFTPPTSLALLNILDENGTTTLLNDYYEGTSYYGGNYSSSDDRVMFRISEHLQEVLLGTQKTKGIYLSIMGAAYNAQRWVIAGPNASGDKKMKCEIKYSIIEE